MAPRLTELELIFLLSELLGTYAIDLARQKGMWQRREPLTTPGRIRALLDALGTVRGVGMVRHALQRACVGSASPARDQALDALWTAGEAGRLVPQGPLDERPR